MSNLKKITALVLALALVMTMFAGAAIKTQLSDYVDEAQFTEAQKNALSLLLPLGVVTGMSSDMIGSSNLTRAEMCVLLYALMNGSIANAAAWTSAPFNDVPATFWGAGYISWASAKGAIYGYGNGDFGPDDPVTPIQAAAMLARLFDAKACSNPETFAQDAQAAAVKYGLVDGIETVNFFGQSVLSRGDMFVMIYNALTYFYGEDSCLLYDVFNIGYLPSAILEGAEKSYYKPSVGGMNTEKAYTVFSFRTATADDVSYFASRYLCVEDDADIDDIGGRYDLWVSLTPTFNGFYQLYAAYEVTDEYYDVRTGTVDDKALIFSGTKQNVFWDANAKVYVNGDVYDANVASVFEGYYGANNKATYKLIDNDGDGFVEYAYINFWTFADFTKGGEWITGNVTYYAASGTYSINSTSYPFGDFWDADAKAFKNNSKKMYNLLGTKYIAISDVQYDFLVKDGYVYDVRISESTQFAGNYGVAVKLNGNFNAYKNMMYITFLNEKNEFVSAYVEKINERYGTQTGYFMKENALVYFTGWNAAGDICELYTADQMMSNYTFNDAVKIADAGKVSATIHAGWNFTIQPDLTKFAEYYALLDEEQVEDTDILLDTDYTTYVDEADTLFVKYAGWKSATAWSADDVYALQMKIVDIDGTPDNLSGNKAVNYTAYSTWTDGNKGVVVYKYTDGTWAVYTNDEEKFDVGNDYAIAYYDATAPVFAIPAIEDATAGPGWDWPPFPWGYAIPGAIEDATAVTADNFNTYKNLYGDMLVKATSFKEIPVGSFKGYMGTKYYAIPMNKVLIDGVSMVSDAAGARLVYEAYYGTTYVTRKLTNVTLSADLDELDADQIQIYRRNGFWGYRAYAEIAADADIDADTVIFKITIGTETYKIKFRETDRKWYALDGDGFDPYDQVGDSWTDYDLAVMDLINELNLGATVINGEIIYDEAIDDQESLLAKLVALKGSYVETSQQLIDTSMGAVFALGRISSTVDTLTWRCFDGGEIGTTTFGCGLYNDDAPTVIYDAKNDEFVEAAADPTFGMVYATAADEPVDATQIYGFGSKNLYINLINYATGDELIFTTDGAKKYAKAVKVTVAGGLANYVGLDYTTNAEDLAGLVEDGYTVTGDPDEVNVKHYYAMADDYDYSYAIAADKDWEEYETPYPYGDNIFGITWIENEPENAKFYVFCGLNNNYSGAGYGWYVMDENLVITNVFSGVGVYNNNDYTLTVGDLILAYTDSEGNIADYTVLANVIGAINYVEGASHKTLEMKEDGTIVSEGKVKFIDSLDNYAETTYDFTNKTVIYVDIPANKDYSISNIKTTFDSKWVGLGSAICITRNYVVIYVYEK